MPSPRWLLFVPVVTAVLVLLRWLAYLWFCGWVIKTTGDPKALREVATAMHALRWWRSNA